ncbi:hypothetical protein [Actinoplanes sp. URMC 104]
MSDCIGVGCPVCDPNELDFDPADVADMDEPQSLPVVNYPDEEPF